jgi:hypothetical protein
LDVDGNLAGVEGLAAGTGLLTGDVVRTVPVSNVACPVCNRPAGALIIDLVAQEVTHRCDGCGHRWTRTEAVGSRAAR